MLRRTLATLVTAAVAATTPMAAAQALTTTRPTSELNRTLTDTRITESSGLARSTYARNLVWTHNDSGSDNVLYAVGKNGATKATVVLSEAQSRDWEDIASGPDHTLWVGDIGNNKKTRTTVQVYKFTEPEALQSTMTAPVTRYDFAYPDGNQNAEAILVHPVTGRLYIVSKSQDGGHVYAAPATLSTTAVNTLTRLNAVPEKVTAASFTPDGSAYVLGNYSTAWIYRDFTTPVVQLAKPSLKQGESLEVTRSGHAIFMGSEGVRSPVYKVAMPAY
jgi:hypothetical protein